MKAIMLALMIIMFGGSNADDVGVGKKISHRIFEAQSKEAGFAKSAYFGRKQLLNLSSLRYSPTSDTLFLLERVAQPGLEVWSKVWVSYYLRALLP